MTSSIIYFFHSLSHTYKFQYALGPTSRAPGVNAASAGLLASTASVSVPRALSYSVGHV